MSGVVKITKNIAGIYKRKRAALYALSLYYAAKALNDFRRKQSNNYYWNNQTGLAKDMVFSDAYMEKLVIGWFIAHGVEYGVYLELGNDGKSQALRPTINEFAKKYFIDAKDIYRD